MQIHTRRFGPCSCGIFVVSAIYTTPGCCPDTTDLTLGADAALHNHVFPQHAPETDRCSIRSNRLVYRLPNVVYAVGHEADCMDTRATGPWIDPLSERLQLDLSISHFCEFLCARV